ncbi:N-acetylmuramoyl-L-alanine amidase [Cohaesibacter gelatinilyticus]|nr:N-acetylmuramoyl-L-alanine amidase [Cohaesibacter gelatinilyticus]
MIKTCCFMVGMMFCLALTAGESAKAQSVNNQEEQVHISAARTAGDLKQARFVLDISGPMPFTAFLLQKPYRLVMDLPAVSFEMAQGIAQVERGLVSNFRFGVINEGRSRVVLDLKGPARIAKAFGLPSVDGNPARAVVELEAVSEQQFTASSLQEVLHVGRNGKRSSQSKLVESVPLPRARAKNGRPVVVLDPGHGGIDTGAVSASGVKESALVLKFAKVLKKHLEAEAGVQVILTRESDKFISLGGRVNFAQAREADLFISIHADSVRESYVRGATVYTLSDRASDQVSAQLAQRENRSDLLAGMHIEEEDDVVADILISLTRRETANHSALYSRTLVGALKNSVRLSKTPARSAGFRVLKAPDIPSVLLELGFLSNRQDQSALTSKAWQEKAIRSIVASVKRFFAKRGSQQTGLLGPSKPRG